MGHGMEVVQALIFEGVLRMKCPFKSKTRITEGCSTCSFQLWLIA